MLAGDRTVPRSRSNGTSFQLTRRFGFAPRCEEGTREHQAVDVAGRRARGSGRVARIAHPAQGVKRRAAWIRGVRVGALLEQERRQLIVRVDDRHRQHARAVGRGVVDVGAGSEQPARRFDVTAAHGEHQRGEVADRPQLDVCPGAHELVDRIRMAFDRRPHERRLIPPRLVSVDRGPTRKERLDRIHMAGPRGRHQRGFTLAGRGVRIGAGGEQRRDDRRISGRRGDRQRRHAIPVLRCDVRAGGNQLLDERGVFALGGKMQGRRAVRLRKVDVGALIDRTKRFRAIAPAQKVDHGSGACLGSGDRPEGEQQTDRQQAKTGRVPHHLFVGPPRRPNNTQHLVWPPVTITPERERR